ncbi:MAG: cytochrome ubiquinol oxidase subunit I, partial [Deltaproteobacteria bacterium]|nr:cytochrome ubiquinol oxidase subunit I [Deltaproteobacteria bacterium]
FLGLVLYGEKRLGKKAHLASTIALWLGSWLSGYFIVATNAFMQHPVGYTVVDGRLQLSDLGAFLLNPWALAAYAHTMSGAVVTGAFFMTAIGAFWTLAGLHAEHARLALRTGVSVGLIACCTQLFPTADLQGKLVAQHQPVALAAMEGVFESKQHAGVALIGQPNLAAGRLDNPIEVPYVLSFLAYGSFGSTVRGLNEFSADVRPDNIELLYYAYHVMAGLGTLFIALMALGLLQLVRKKLDTTRPLLWALMLSLPFPYIANTAGWMTAELGRQPWLVYGLFRTEHGTSPHVGAGDTLFSLVGFAGIYFVVGVLFLVLVGREIAHGPGAHGHDAHGHDAHAPEGPTPAPAAAGGH